MTVVLLLGYSCAGKSTLLRVVQEKWPTVETLDSDEWVAESLGVRHIFELFLREDDALSHIEATEAAFLESLHAGGPPTLIAAGPFLVTREPEFSLFKKRLEPESIYLAQTPEEVLAGLRQRRADHERKYPELVDHPRFGSWDDGNTTRRNGSRWEPLPDQDALRNIKRNMASAQGFYNRETRVSHRFGQSSVRREREKVVDKIGSLLGVL